MNARRNPVRQYGNQGSAAPADAKAPSLFTAMQEQLGMKFESSRAPVDVMVIDSVEHPSPN